MARGAGRSPFDLGAGVYDVLTSQDYWRAQISRVLDFLETPPRSLRVLDLGCGPGVSTFVLAEKLGPGARIVGIDLAHEMISRARRHLDRRRPELHNVRFEHSDAKRIGFPDASFDLAVGHSFLYLVDDRAAVLSEVRRLLTPGGTLVLMEPCAQGSLARAAGSAFRAWREALGRPWHAGRFVASMVLWRLASARAGRISAEWIEQQFLDAGLLEVSTCPTLAGLGLHCVGRAP